MPVTLKSNLTDSDDASGDEMNPDHLPKLKRAHGNHVKHYTRRSNSASLSHRPCYRESRVTNKFPKYPHIIYGNLLITGYFRQNTEWRLSVDGLHPSAFSVYNNNIPDGIAMLCKKYSFTSNNGIFQLSHKISRIMKEAQRTLIQKETLKCIIYQYLKKRCKVSLTPLHIQFYFNELIRLKYMEPFNATSDTLYYVNEFMQILPKT